MAASKIENALWVRLGDLIEQVDERNCHTDSQVAKATVTIISIQIEPNAHLFTPNGVH